MNDKEAIALASRGKQPDQAAIRRLHRIGAVVVDDITTLDSPGQVLIVTAITEKGQRMLAPEDCQ